MIFTDEQLNALLDGELDTNTEAKIRTALLIDQELADRFEQLAYVDALVRTNYESIDSQPMPKSVINLLAEQPENKHQAEIVKLRTSWPPIWLTKVAAVALLGAGLGLAVQMIGPSPAPLNNSAVALGPVSTNSHLHQILNSSPSAITQNVIEGDEIRITPVLTFQHIDGRYCREYTAHSASASNRAVACIDNSEWQIVLSGLDNSTAGDAEYATASATTPTAFEEQITQMIDGTPLSADSERLLLNGGWHSSSTSD